MNSLYTFKKNAWHILFFNWIWNTDVVSNYKTFCPYFWQYVLTILFLPIILLSKFIVFISNKFMSAARNKKEEKSQKLVQSLINAIKQAKTDEDYLKIYLNRCYNNIIYSAKWHVDNDKYYHLLAIGGAYDSEQYELRQVKKHKQEYKLDKIKFSVLGRITTTLAVSVIGLTIIFLVGIGLYYFCDWFFYLFTMEQFIEFWLIIIISLTIGIIGYGIISLFIILFEYFNICPKNSCTKILGFISIPFIKIWYGFVFIIKGIWKLFLIFIDFIKATYHSSCPVITYKD